MEIVSLALEGGSHIAGHLPGFIAKRVFTGERLRQQVEIDLRGQAPLNLGGAPKVLSAWLTVTNQSNIPLRVVSISAEIWFGQPTAFITHVIPIEVPRRSRAENIRLAAVLSADLAANARSAAENRAGIIVYTTIVCTTTTASFIVEKRFEREARDVHFDGPPMACA